MQRQLVKILFPTLLSLFLVGLTAPGWAQDLDSEQVNLGLVQAVCCENPATLFSLKKGRIEVGYDADLAIFDLDDIHVIQADRLHSKCGWSPFEGFNAIFPKHVMLRGELVLSENELKVKGRGKLVETGQLALPSAI